MPTPTAKSALQALKEKVSCPEAKEEIDRLMTLDSDVEVIDGLKALYEMLTPEEQAEVEKTIEKIVAYGKTLESAPDEGRFVEAVNGSEGRVWEVILIASGMTKTGRKYYPPRVLEQAVPLFEGAKCFADHPTRTEMVERPARSIRDVVGWFSNVRWDAERSAIKADLHLLESESQLKSKLIEAWSRGKTDLFGLSVDFLGRFRESVYTDGKPCTECTEIVQVLSVDIVTRPNAGGAFVKVLEEAQPMENENAIDQLRKELERIKEEQAKLLRERELNDLLMSAKNLPVAARDRIRRRFENVAFTREDVEKAIQEEREYIASISTPPQTPYQGVRIVETERDKIIKGIEGLLGGKTDVPAFRSLREAYSVVTRKPYFEVSGEEILMATAPSLVRSAEAVDTTTWADYFDTALQRRLAQEFALPGYDEWRQFCTVQIVDNMRVQERYTFGGYPVLTSPTEGSDYDDLDTFTPLRQTIRLAPYGGLETLSLQAVASDDVGALRLIPKRLATAAKVTIYNAVFGVFENNPEMDYDGVDLFHATHGNLGTAPLTYEALVSAREAMLSQTLPVSVGTSMTYLDNEPKFLLVPVELARIAWELANSDFVVDYAKMTNIPNIFKSLGITPIVVRHWTDSNDWFLVADPNKVPTIEVDFYQTDQPQVFTELANTGASFSADALRFKVRIVFGVAPLVHFGMYASTVTP